jgi:hypothetical protein
MNAYAPEIAAFIAANCKGVTTIELTQKINAVFETSYTASQIASYKSNHALRSGLTTRYKRGHTPHNKGRKGYRPAGCEKGWFQAGHTSKTHKPVGTESFRRDGYWWVKVEEPNKWREKHRIVWEAANGKEPEGHMVTFLDGDRNNCGLENLTLITRAEHGIMTSCKLRSDNADMTKTGLLLTKVQIAKAAAEKKIQTDERSK